MRWVSVGTKSLTFGVHQFLWHPITVYWAWKELYGSPNLREMVCILIHDWGYLGKRSMDGEDGVSHPELGARIAGRIFGKEYSDMVLGHSRTYSQRNRIQVSRLCYADKLSIVYEPSWFYLLRAWASGELKEYRRESAKSGFAAMSESHRKWLLKLKDEMRFVATAEPGYLPKLKGTGSLTSKTENLLYGVSETH